jgi:GxxExxY protein
MTPRDPITASIIGGAFKVANTLGNGFLEKVYENALALELRNTGMEVVQQQEIDVQYQGTIVGRFVADLLVEGSVIVELKAVKKLDDFHVAQCINYLKATGVPTCLLLNFGLPKIEIRRLMMDRATGRTSIEIDPVEKNDFKPAMDGDGQR